MFRSITAGFWWGAMVLVISLLTGCSSPAPWAKKERVVTTAEVKRGEFIDYLQVSGEIDPERSTTITAPVDAGELRILSLVRDSSILQKGDVICTFDTTNLQKLLNQKRTEWKSAEAEIEQARAKAQLDQERHKTEVLTARYNVERARLDAGKQEILSPIEGEKMKLDLQNAEQRLAETEQKGKFLVISNEIEVEAKKRKRDKALAEVRRVERQISDMTLRAPLPGIVTIAKNYRSSGASFKQGDTVWPRGLIAGLPDLSRLRFNGQVDEIDRGRLKQGQPATIMIDALPDKQFSGEVDGISLLAKADLLSGPYARSFEVVLKMNSADPRIRPRMRARARIVVNRIPNCILVPAEAVFLKNGGAKVYVLKGSGFEERQIEIADRGLWQIHVRAGLQPGEKVSLKDPTQEVQEK